MTSNSEMTDQAKFHGMLNAMIQFFEEGLKLEKNPPEEIVEFYTMLVGLETAVSTIKGPNEFEEFIAEHSDELEILADFATDMEENQNSPA